MILGNEKNNKIINTDEKNKYYVSEEKISLNYKNDSHSLIAAQVEKNATVLDVGCAQGMIGKYLKEELHCKVYGIEIDEVARKIAIEKHCYEKIYSFSISDKKNEEYKKFFKNDIKFDYIIFADLLEHLIDPADAIYECQKLLKPTGKILISMPNIAHFDIIYGLLNDNFNYSKTGLLDNTHLRFFTENSFIDMINQMNEYYNIKFKVKLIAVTVIKPDYCDEKEKIYSILMKNKNMNVLQNIFELSYSEKPINNNNRINLYKVLENEYQRLIDDNRKLEKKINKINTMYKNLELEKKSILESKIVLDSEKADILKKYAELEVTNEKIKENNKKLSSINEKKINELNNVNNTLQGIYNSKTWKTLDKIKRILRIFRRK